MLVDGAILDNVPIGVMHELKSGPNVVISFEVPKLQRFEVDYRTLPGRAALLKAMLNPLLRRAFPRAPGPGTVLMRAMMANRQGFERRPLTQGALVEVLWGLGLLAVLAIVSVTISILLRAIG